MQALGIGDLHLTSSVGKGGLAAYVKNADQVVANDVIRVLNWGKKRGIKNCFLYGDVCEGTRMSYEGQLALLRILRQDFEFDIILGNHDLFSEDPSLGHSLQLLKEFDLPNVRIHEHPTVKRFGKAKVRFLPWPHADFDEECLNVAHIDVAGAATDSGRKILKGQKSKATAVVGHIHTMQQVRNTFFSGTIYQTDFGQRKEKYFHHLEFDAGEWTVNTIPFKPTYTLHTYEITSRKQLKAIPRSAYDLVKLVLLDGVEIDAAATAGINVVMVKTVNGAQELALERVADLAKGSSIEFSSDEFFEAWLANQALEEELKTKTRKLRTSILKRRDK